MSEPTITDEQLYRLTDVGISEDEARELIRVEMRRISAELAPGYRTLDGNSDLLDVGHSSPAVTDEDTRKARAHIDDLGDALYAISVLPPDQQEEAATFVFGSVEQFETEFLRYQQMTDPVTQQGLRDDGAAQARRASDEEEIAQIRAGKTSTGLRTKRTVTDAELDALDAATKRNA